MFFFPKSPSSIVNSIQNQKSNKAGKSQFMFARQVSLWFCRDLVPLNTVEKTGFNDFWKYLNTSFDLPSRSTIAIGALDDLYICCKNKLIERLANTASHATITFDSWTDNHKRISYVTYTYHFVENWKMKTAVLKTASFPHPHTADRIKDDYDDTLAEFNVVNKNLTVVTDGARAMKKTAELLNVYRFYCLGHIVHLLIRADLLKHDAMQPLRDLILKMRQIHKKLMYKHEELRDMSDEFMQQKILLLIEEHREMGTYSMGDFYVKHCFIDVYRSCVLLLLSHRGNFGGRGAIRSSR